MAEQIQLECFPYHRINFEDSTLYSREVEGDEPGSKGGMFLRCLLRWQALVLRQQLDELGFEGFLLVLFYRVTIADPTGSIHTVASVFSLAMGQLFILRSSIPAPDEFFTPRTNISRDRKNG